ncbi:MAG: hypothetical protein CVV22_07475 [Ignavibacteriae bacterium HGW-Ignavibacteriae-1]|nr:MAG: hypothetical protein CVV22_07475 [Ignavibacteriae bacterium HGW-Ignavibacteriae-1]
MHKIFHIYNKNRIVFEQIYPFSDKNATNSGVISVLLLSNILVTEFQIISYLGAYNFIFVCN